MKGIYEKPTANLILSGETLTVFPLRLGRRQECPLLLLLFNVVLDNLARAYRQKEIKGIYIREEEGNTLFADAMVLHIEYCKQLTRKTVRANKSNKVLEDVAKEKNQLHFYTLLIKNLKMKLRKIPFTIVSKKNKVLRNKFNKIKIRLVH